MGNRRIPDQSTEPYPHANGEHARGPVRFMHQLHLYESGNVFCQAEKTYDFQLF